MKERSKLYFMKNGSIRTIKSLDHKELFKLIANNQEQILEASKRDRNNRVIYTDEETFAKIKKETGIVDDNRLHIFLDGSTPNHLFFILEIINEEIKRQLETPSENVDSGDIEVID